MQEFEASVKIRYRTQAILCKVTIKQDKGKVELYESVYGLAHGQIAAFYDGDRLLGGATII